MTTTNLSIAQEWVEVSTTSTLVQFNTLGRVELATGTTRPDASFSGMLLTSGNVALYTLDGETLYGRVRPQYGVSSTTLILEPMI